LGKEFVDNLTISVAEKTAKQLSFLEYAPEIKKELQEFDKNINHKINFLSYSQIESFNTCPLQYKYKSIIKIPAPSSFALSFGSVIHETMRDFYQKFIAKQKVSKEKLLELLTENWVSQGFLSKRQEEDYKKEGVKILTEYFNKSFDEKTKVLSLEQNFSVRISPDLKMGGKIDRIDKTENGIEIIDYKTGKSTTKKDVEKDLQLSLYALSAIDGTLTFMGLLPQIPKPEEVKVSFYFFDNQEKVSTTRTKESFDLLKKELVEKSKEIEKSDFSPTPGKHCDFCEYRMICEAWS
jgi:DNA helicase-2/ATP-dependent DNA helicase PcrA